MLTDIQKDILVGSLLGDGCLERSKASHNAILAIGRSVKDLEYLEWQYLHFKDLCVSGIKTSIQPKKDGKTYNGVRFRTKSLPELTEYHNKWYTPKKIVPKDLELNPLIIAVWFCDDGCVFKRRKNSVAVEFSTQGFLKKDVEFLAKLLSERYGQHFSVLKSNKNKEYYKIKGYHRAAMTLFKDIDPIFNFLPRKRDIYKEFLDHDLNNIKFDSLKRVDVLKLNEFICNKVTFNNKDVKFYFGVTNDTIGYHLRKYTKLGYLISEKEENKRDHLYTITPLGLLNIGKEQETK